MKGIIIMKKMVGFALAIMMTATMAVNVLAAGSLATNNGGDTSITVKGAYDKSTAGKVVSVGIAWGEMTFTYSEGESTWHPDNHTTTTTTASWSAKGNDITITNHSNVGITASLGFAANNNGVRGKFYDAATDGSEKSSVSLARAEEDSALDSRQETVYFNITDGTISAATDNLGTIKVSIKEQ